MGKLMILNGTGHTVVTENLRQKALSLLQQGYEYWENAAPADAPGVPALGARVGVADITDEMNLVALRPIVGG